MHHLISNCVSSGLQKKAALPKRLRGSRLINGHGRHAWWVVLIVYFTGFKFFRERAGTAGLSSRRSPFKILQRFSTWPVGLGRCCYKVLILYSLFLLLINNIHPELGSKFIYFLQLHSYHHFSCAPFVPSEGREPLRATQTRVLGISISGITKSDCNPSSYQMLL